MSRFSVSDQVEQGIRAQAGTFSDEGLELHIREFTGLLARGVRKYDLHCGVYEGVLAQGGYSAARARVEQAYLVQFSSLLAGWRGELEVWQDEQNKRKAVSKRN